MPPWLWRTSSAGVAGELCDDDKKTKPALIITSLLTHQSRYIVDEISKWTRRRNSRWLPAKLSLHDLLEQSQLRLAALTLDPLAGSSARPPPMPLGSLSTPSGAISSDYGSVPSSPEGSQQFAPVIPVMIRDPSNYMPAFGPTSFGPPQPGTQMVTSKRPRPN